MGTDSRFKSSKERSSIMGTHVRGLGLFRCIVFCACMLLCTSASGQEPGIPESARVADYFCFYGSGGGGIGGGIDWKSLREKKNDPILRACLGGAAKADLEKLGLEDLEERLSRLEQGNVIRKAGDRYVLAFPVIIGQRRTELQKRVQHAAAVVQEEAEKIVERVRTQYLNDRAEMLYHVLWSVIMDGEAAWDAAAAELGRQASGGDCSHNNKGWVIYPRHPYMVGTNGYGRMRITWSPATPSPNSIHSAIQPHESELVAALREKRPVKTGPAQETLRKYGLVDEGGKVLAYAFQEDQAETYDGLGSRFGQMVVSKLNIAELAKSLGVTPGEAFLVSYHEVCWEVLGNLGKKGILKAPHVPRSEPTALARVVELVSFKLAAPFEDAFLRTEPTEEEKAVIRQFDEAKSRILNGEKYSDTSTPVAALLSFISARLSKDMNAYRNAVAMRIPASYRIPDDAEADAECRTLRIFRVAAWPRNPAEGAMHPIYVMYGGESRFSDVQVFIFHKGQWQKLFNTGDPKDWQEDFRRNKNMILNNLK
jgi:hypothetical protein